MLLLQIHAPSLLYIIAAITLISNKLVLSSSSIHVFPNTAPYTPGGTTLHISTNSSYYFPNDIACQLFIQDTGIITISNNIVYNSTYMTCILPSITNPLYVQGITNNANTLRLQLISQSTGVIANNETNTNLTIFDLNDIIITRITPNYGLITNSTTRVYISGSQFINTSSITCNIPLLPPIQGTYINTSCILCIFPSRYPITLQFNVRVYLNGQSISQVSLLKDNVTMFTYYSTPPQAIDCSFSSSYTSLLLSFDREVEIGGENDYNTTTAANLNCDLIFDSFSLHILGGENITKCTWFNTQQRNIIVALSSYTSVYPGIQLKLNPNTIRTRYVRYSKLASGNITIKVNRQITSLDPIAIIETTHVIPACSNFTLNGNKSLYSGPLPLLYQWNITDIEYDDDDDESSGLNDDSIVIIDNYIPNGYTNQSIIILPTMLFTQSTVYNITLSVRNFLSFTHTTSIIITKQSVPIITVIGGNRERSLSTDKLFMIETITTYLDCNINTPLLTFQWNVHHMINNTMIPVSLLNIKLNSPLLQILPNSLTPSSMYILTLNVYNSSSTSTSTTNTSIKLHTVYPTVQSIIQGGTLIVYGRNDPIILDASNSYGSLNKVYTVQWSCVSLNGTNCHNTLHNTTLSILNLFQTYIPTNSLKEGQYIIQSDIIYNNSLILSSTTQNIIVTSSEGETTSFVYLYTPTHPIHIHSKLTLTGSVKSETVAYVQWTCVHVIGYAYISLENITLTSLHVTDTLSSLSENNQSLLVSSLSSNCYTNPISFHIQPWSLLPGNRYRFQLTLTDIYGRQRYSQTDISTSSLPSSGRLLVIPSNGISLVTHFKLNAIHWSVDYGNAPIYYRYGYTSIDNNNTVWLTSITEENSHTTFLPTNTLEIILQIYDSRGAVFTTTQIVNVIPSQQPIDLMALYDELYTLIVRQKRWNTGLSKLIAILTSLCNKENEFLNESYTNVFKQLSIELLANFLSFSPLPSTKDSLSRVLTIYELCLCNNDVDNIQLNNASVNLILNGLEIIINNYVINDKDPFGINKGITQNETQQIIDIYDKLVIIRANNFSPIINNRIISNDIFTSYERMLSNLSYGLCQSSGLYESSVIITSLNFGTLKVYHSIPPWEYNLSCSSNSDVGNVRRGCPFSSLSSNVTFGQDIFNEYSSVFCTRNNNLGNYTRCEGSCIVSTQFKYNAHWSGNAYVHHVISNPAEIQLRSPTRRNKMLSLPITVGIPLISNISGTIECVYWNDSKWMNNNCHTNIVSSYSVECTCPLNEEIAVINKCPNGYYGIYCNKVCPQGQWGEQCSQKCQCNDRGDCSPVNGSCDCIPGWKGASCQTMCDNTHWGKRCEQNCLCQNGDCSSVDGTCDCSNGWQGIYCNESCNGGYYGKYCSSICTCRSIEECDSITGHCICQTGYTGSTCNDTCTEGYYGNECNLTCNCNDNGTLNCDPFNGTCYCMEQWIGDRCEYEIIYSSPSMELATPPVWQLPVTAGVPSLLVILVLIILLVLVLLFIKKKRRKKKIVPINKVGQDEKGEQEDEENVLQITRSRSLVRMIKNQKAGEMETAFTSNASSPAGTFQEPEVLGSKLRWQIIQLLSANLSTNKERKKPNNNNDLSIEDFELQITLDEEQSDEFEEVVFLKGIYLEPTATLKELRNVFADSKQLENGSLYFQFLLSDTPGDVVIIDDEETITLKRFEAQEKTVYIHLINKSDALMELCVCGKFAELECTECRGKGYCSQSCQDKDWNSHVKICRVVSARRREDKKRRKLERKQKRVERLSRAGISPNPTDVCGRCGRLAEYECTNCGVQGYCSEECQTKDWKYHRLYCEQQAQFVNNIS